MKTLYVHIGTPKTGTTAIQNFCVENAPVFESKGYCYPKFPFVYERISKMRNGHFLIGGVKNSYKKISREQEESEIAEAMKQIRDLFLIYDNVILSDEDIWRYMDDGKETLWRDLKQEADKNGFCIHIIVYLRRQDQFLSSNWNQVVKKRVGRLCESTFKEYMDNVNKDIRLEYYEKLERVAEVLGKENITVRRYGSDCFAGGSIYSDFLSTVGLFMTEEYIISKGVRNTGLYGNTHEIKRLLNALPQMENKHSQDFILETLMECSEMSQQEYHCEMLSKEEKEAFLGVYKAGNQKIAEEYLHETGTELFDYTMKDLPKWQKDNPYMIDDVIRFIGVTSIYLHQQDERIEKEINELKQEIKALKKDLKHPVKTFVRCVRNNNKKDTKN